MIEKLLSGVYRICIPFEEVYTTVFVLVEGNEAIIYDSATTDGDVERYVLPELSSMGVTVRYLVTSHNHGDHSGGLGALKRAYPLAVPVSFVQGTDAREGDVLIGRFELVALAGHSPDCLGIYDIQSGALLTADALQLQGVGKYRTYFYDYDTYIATVEKVRSLKPHMIIASHDYEPLGFIAKGTDEVGAYLDECIRAADAKINKNT